MKFVYALLLILCSCIISNPNRDRDPSQLPPLETSKEDNWTREQNKLKGYYHEKVDRSKVYLSSQYSFLAVGEEKFEYVHFVRIKILCELVPNSPVGNPLMSRRVFWNVDGRTGESETDRNGAIFFSYRSESARSPLKVEIKISEVTYPVLFHEADMAVMVPGNECRRIR